MNISFIGYGNMARAIIDGLQTNHTHNLSVASPSLQPGRDEHFTTDCDNLAVIKDADVIVLAVKPAKMGDVLTQIGHDIPEQAVLVSVAAGIDLAWIASFCNEKQAIVRAMPNIALSAGKGATPLVANEHLDILQKKRAETIFNGAGIIRWLDDESLLNAYTAVSGSGPAYVFLFVEAMTRAAEKLGLDKEAALSFTTQTIHGALALMEQTGLSAFELRQQVTSPAGTTAAAIAVLQQREFDTILLKAMHAACERAKQLGSIDMNKE
ncbi:pyrroline-5-carboxylate reductase [Legionella spiritensis]|uniref:Pyrroline-5-carboxylate reductase n=1 Tax=Legionella spiritensis TaxID=452 RepID=A0A0W0YY21_LEGSP|nr:pyrroline-5-carboxylate reductase [Legionella spiritensis]KTD61518.1 pyrroline-5-carboxylate reductase [Legionella spiritensis]SNV32908.1 pyrroline-5-carboxylate reductase [Legionella spiritensis]VEG92311.1 pyrroline-5-carboxylate reductase [Legionella spiritensis]